MHSLALEHSRQPCSPAAHCDTHGCACQSCVRACGCSLSPPSACVTRHSPLRRCRCSPGRNQTCILCTDRRWHHTRCTCRSASLVSTAWGVGAGRRRHGARRRRQTVGSGVARAHGSARCGSAGELRCDHWSHLETCGGSRATVLLGSTVTSRSQQVAAPSFGGSTDAYKPLPSITLACNRLRAAQQQEGVDAKLHSAGNVGWALET